MGGPRGPASQFRLYCMHPEMSLLRRFVIRATQELRNSPEARAKASQVLEEQVKPRARAGLAGAKRWAPPSVRASLRPGSLQKRNMIPGTWA